METLPMQRRTLLAIALILPLSAEAHEPRIGPNGGLLVDAGPHHVEVLAKGNIVDIYISDAADRPLPATGFKATAVLVVNGKPQRIALEPADTRRLSGTAAVALPTPLKGVVLLTAPDGKTAQARLN
jgi:hypothetical protein